MTCSDSPFSKELTSYLASRLRAVGVDLDQQWLRDAEAIPSSALLLDGHSKSLEEARRNIPQTLAQWELAPFFKHALPAAVFDLVNGPIKSITEFHFLYERLLGPAASPWICMLFLAAACSPNLAVEERLELIGNFDLNALKFD